MFVSQIHLTQTLFEFEFLGTKLTGDMPSFLRDVAPQLESMEPQDAILAENVFAKVMSSKRKSSALQKLKMTSCNCSEDFWKKLFNHLPICKKLTHLIVSHNSLGEAGRDLARSIRMWGPDPPLQVLQLDQCLMPEIAWRDLCWSLHSCKHITHLDLSYNKLGNAGSELAQAISDWGDESPLQKVDLSYCSMSAEACDDLFYSLFYCKRLTYLDLSGNMVGEAGHYLAEVIRSWGDDPPLETFIAEHCFIPTVVWPDLLRSLSACSKLIHLDLSHNILTGCLSSLLPGPRSRLYSLAALLSSLFHRSRSGLHSLSNFFLDSCSLNQEDLQHLTKYLDSEKLPSLQNLYLHDNRLCRKENVLGELIQSCIDHYRGTGVKLWVQGNSLSQDFMNTWVAQCKNTNVQLDLPLPTSAEKNLPTKVKEWQMV